MRVKNTLVVTALAVILITVAWAPGSAFANGPRGALGAVYAMTNAPDGNEVVVYSRDAKGYLRDIGSFPTGGLGTGGDLDPLGSQGSLILSQNHQWLLAVNGGSDEISLFRTTPCGPILVEVVLSGGEFPVSLTLDNDLLYVLNAGGDASITGFRMDHKGRLTPLEDSTRSLGEGVFSQVAFDPKGRVLLITDRGDQEILVFPVSEAGTPSAAPVVSASVGAAPFGFVFDRRGHLVVSEAGSGAVSSYDILEDGTLSVITPSEANGQTATCWIAGTRWYAYTANTASNTLSAYRVNAEDGSVSLLDDQAGTGDLPLDLDTTEDGRFLYVLNAGDGTVGMFRIRYDGSLFDLGTIPGLPTPYAQGIISD